MTRLYAARKLLALGPLTLADFIEITGWPARRARQTLAALTDRGFIEYEGNTRCGLYRSAE